MHVLRAIIRIIVESYTITRYVISALTLLIILVYSILYLTGYVPYYGRLAASLNLSVTLLLALLYVAVALVVILMWHLLTRANARSSFARMVYRQTDTTGLHWLNLLVVVIVMLGVFSLPQQTKMDREVVTFIAFLVLASILFDYLPIRRPRRWLVPRHVRSREQIEQTLDQGNWSLSIGDLEAYNEFPIQSDQGDNQLPDGMFIEIPPR
ncbi:hypothetical protein [Candidatus Amarolinea aalborgensis]|uniref:hypothetical protein n=1 Tax=Candidatus Amarolinea aalborgensis TaxID=2249329 RepID=UPI003BF9872A